MGDLARQLRPPGEVLLVKGGVDSMVEAARLFQALGADLRVADMWRCDLLAFMACRVRDCFGDIVARGIGVPVLAASGERTDSCFQRRRANAKPR